MRFSRVSRASQRLRSRNSLVRISSLRRASQLTSSVSISSWRSSRCSGVRPSTHFCLSNLEATRSAAEVEELAPALLAAPAPAAGFGAAKKDMMLPFCLAFLASFTAAWFAAFLLRVDIMGAGAGRRVGSEKRRAW